MYVFAHKGKVYGPDGPMTDADGTPLDARDADEYNRQVERAEIAHLQTAPESVLLYVFHDKCLRSCCRTAEAMHAIACPVCHVPMPQAPRGDVIGTWLGTIVATHVQMRPRRTVGFQSHMRGGTYRRAVSCRFYGVRYHGWYMESSGDYVRLRKARRQS